MDTPPTNLPVHVLHTHSVYSILDGVGTIPQYLKYCQENGLEACSCTDHGYVMGLYELITKAQQAKIKPIPGCEFYLMPPVWYEYNTERSFNFFHLTVWAQNNQGYQNLLSLATRSWEQGRVVYPWGKPRPRITLEDLRLYHEGLIVGSGCIEGPICKPLLRGEFKMSDRMLAELWEIFQGRMYFEVMPGTIDDDFYKGELIQVDNVDGITFTFHPEDVLKTEQGEMTAAQAYAQFERGHYPVTQIVSATPNRAGHHVLSLSPEEQQASHRMIEVDDFSETPLPEIQSERVLGEI